MTNQKVIKQALEAFKEIADETYDSWTNGAKAKRIAQAMIPKLEEALAKQEQGEPVAVKVDDATTGTQYVKFLVDECLIPIGTRFYTTPQQRKPLTADQKHDLVTNFFSDSWAIEKAMELIDDYEAAHGIEGNT